MAKRPLTTVVRFSRDYRRPPRFGMGLPPKRPHRPPHDPVTYLRAVIVASVLGLLLLPSFADAVSAALKPALRGATGCRVVQVVDGDTVTLWCNGGPERARVAGFDTPELFSPSCAGELAAALSAKWRLRWLLWTASEVVVVKEGRDRYDRALVAVFTDGTNISHRMIADGHARSYDGGQRASWCG